LKKIINKILTSFMIFIIKIYKVFVSPFIGVNCRFFPSCSEYSIQAFKDFGFFKGIILSLKRICRCHPLCKSGYDPVPKRKKKI
tara:strand:+ start:446 stop:697 length:252 start_codon:yes stop_codon:yes gene_type:complete